MTNALRDEILLIATRLAKSFARRVGRLWDVDEYVQEAVTESLVVLAEFAEGRHEGKPVKGTVSCRVWRHLHAAHSYAHFSVPISRPAQEDLWKMDATRKLMEEESGIPPTTEEVARRLSGGHEAATRRLVGLHLLRESRPIPGRTVAAPEDRPEWLEDDAVRHLARAFPKETREAVVSVVLNGDAASEVAGLPGRKVSQMVRDASRAAAVNVGVLV